MPGLNTHLVLLHTQLLDKVPKPWHLNKQNANTGDKQPRLSFSFDYTELTSFVQNIILEY